MLTRALAAFGKRIPEWPFSNRFTDPIVDRVGPHIASGAAQLADGIFYDESEHALLYDSEESEAWVAGYVKGFAFVMLVGVLWYLTIVLWQVGISADNPWGAGPLLVAVFFALGLARWLDDLDVEPFNERISGPEVPSAGDVREGFE